MSGTPFIGINMSEVNELALDLLATTVAALPAVTAIIEVGANKIKKEAQANISAVDVNERLKHYPDSITYDIDVDPTGTVAGEIGPEKDRAQGALGNVLEYGTSVSAPVPHLQPALEGEATIVQAEIAIATGRLMLRRRHP